MSGITLVIEDPAWRRHRGLQTRLKQAADAAVRAVKLRGEITILLAGDARLKGLNQAFRGKDKSTNVLSFPTGAFDGRAADGAAAGGDIAIAHGVVAREAKEQGKRFADHAIHLAVHGVLHLAGHDHIKAKDAQVMEPLEVKILKRLGIADPYLVAPPSPARGGGGRSTDQVRRQVGALK
jgi:probable rRNA maturation factor